MYTDGFIYNVTTQVSWGIHEGWLEWLNKEHAPAIIGTGCFAWYQVLRLHEVDESEGPTYAVQYFTASKYLYNQYISEHSNTYRQQGYDKWGSQFASFHTVMELEIIVDNNKKGLDRTKKKS